MSSTHAAIPIEQYERQQSTRTPRLSWTDTNVIMSRNFPAIRWTVPGYVPEGLSILAGRQKLGKTWLALDWAIAVASGYHAMGSVPCEQGDVLYLDFENGARRIQGRINTLFPDGRQRPELSRLVWAGEAPLLNSGLVEALEDWRLSMPEPRLVVLDVLQRVKPVARGNQTSYESDYVALSGLQRWAIESGIAVVALHHTRKGGADDPLEALSGSNGLSACADTTLVLDRDQNGITLYVRGRDVEEKESALNFSGGNWAISGDAAHVRRSDERSVILEFLADNPDPITPTELAALLGWKSNNTKQLLFKLARAGDVARDKGRYFLSDR